MLKTIKDVYCNNKKVLLRERKRHTDRRVVSTPSVVLTGYPPSPCPATPAGYPPHPDLACGGSLLGGVPPWQVTPPPPGWIWQGTSPRCLPHGILGNVAKHYGIWVPPLGVCPMAFGVMLQSIMGYGYPPQVWTN